MYTSDPDSRGADNMNAALPLALWCPCFRRRSVVFFGFEEPEMLQRLNELKPLTSEAIPREFRVSVSRGARGCPEGVPGKGVNG